MKIKYLQNEATEGPGHIAQWAFDNKHTIEGVMLFNNEALPSIESFDLLVILGGSMSMDDLQQFPWIDSEKEYIRKAVFEGKSVLGISLGSHLLADALGAKVIKNRSRAIGWQEVTTSAEATETSLGRVLPKNYMAFNWHSDKFELPPGGYHLGYTDGCFNQGFVWKDRVVGLQYRSEVTAESVQYLSAAYDRLMEKSKQPAAKISDSAYIRQANSTMDSVLSYFEKKADLCA